MLNPAAAVTGEMLGREDRNNRWLASCADRYCRVEEALLVVSFRLLMQPGLAVPAAGCFIARAITAATAQQEGLCYAVFALPWQQAAAGGLLLATQSSTTSARALFQALRQAVQDSVGFLQPEQLQQAVEAFREEAGQGRLPLSEWGQWLFSAWQRSGYQGMSTLGVNMLPATDSAAAADALCQVLDDRHWVVLSNQPGCGA